MKERYFRVRSNKAIYKLPISLVAKDRASYYEKREPGCYQDEYDLTMEDDYEAIDWIRNNMNVDEWRDHLILVKKIETEEDLSDADISLWKNQDK